MHVKVSIRQSMPSTTVPSVSASANDHHAIKLNIPKMMTTKVKMKKPTWPYPNLDVVDRRREERTVSFGPDGLAHHQRRPLWLRLARVLGVVPDAPVACL